MAKKTDPIYVSEVAAQSTDLNTPLTVLVLILSFIALMLLVYLVLESRKINQL